MDNYPQLSLILLSISDDLKGLSKVWILGDNFLAKSYRKNFKKAQFDSYLKDHYEVLAFCSSKYSDKKKFAVASLLGPWIEYLAEFISESLEDRHQKLSLKARLAEKTQVYWVESVNHDNFDYINQQVRETFSQCLEATSKSHETMRVLKMQEFWNKKDDNLVLNNRFTKQGLVTYWKAMDASIQFSVKKREQFFIRMKFCSLRSATETAKVTRGRVMRPTSEDFQEIPHGQFVTDEMSSSQEDDIQHFFRHHRQDDHFHWSSSRLLNNRFLLPKLKQ